MHVMTYRNFGPWMLDAKYYVLRIEGVRKPTLDLDGAEYEVDLETCLTSAQVLDWVMQVSRKTWATDAVIASLIRALEEVLNPQAHLCSFGASKSLTRAQVRGLVDRAATPQGAA